MSFEHNTITDFSCIPLQGHRRKLQESTSILQNDHHPKHKSDEYEIINDTKRILKQGYLSKKSAYLSISRKRWIVLHGVKLYSFKDPECDHPTEIFDLTEYNTISHSKHSNIASFKLQSSLSGKSREFIASNMNEMYEWIKFITSIQWTNIALSVIAKRNNCYFVNKFKLYIKYDPSLLLLDIINCAIKRIENKYYPQRLWLCKIRSDSFTGETYSKIRKHSDSCNCIDPDSLNKPITNWQYSDIQKKGLYLIFDNIFVHKITNLTLSCPYMLHMNTNNPLQCPIYYDMIHSHSHEYNQDNMCHLDEYIHFKNEYFEKPLCKLSQNCVCYKRLEKGEYGICDIYHLKLWRHPARSTRAIRMQYNMQQLVVNSQENNGIYASLASAISASSVLQASICDLMQEVIRNKYKSDLFLSKSDRKNSHYSILDAVNDKYDCFRHNSMNKPLNKTEILALFLYTNCKCAYDLCESQRNGNYKKWKVFDYHLFQAIYKLNKAETGKYPLYSGLNHMQLRQEKLSHCYLNTYASTSWNKDIVMSFVGGRGQGMLIQIESITRRKHMICCDVSWISHFVDECEVLIARSSNKYPQSFNCSVINSSVIPVLDKIYYGIQTVQVKNTFERKSKMNAYFRRMQRTRKNNNYNINSMDPGVQLQPYGELMILHQSLGMRYNAQLPLNNCYDHYV